MYVQFCYAVFIVAVAVANSENGVKPLRVAGIVKANVSREGVRTSDDHDTKPMPAVSSGDRSTILNTFNCQRGLLGASDMTYLSWSSSLEADTNVFLQGCDFDAPFYSSTTDSYIVKVIETGKISYQSSVESLYSSDIANSVTSKYMLQVSGGYKYCATIRYEGVTYSNGHFYGYGISTTSSFNDAIRQYTVGNACTRCEPGVFWCYSNLCRDDCSNSITGCCSITNNIPAQCSSFNIPCDSSSRIEISSNILMLLFASALYSYLQ